MPGVQRWVEPSAEHFRPVRLEIGERKMTHSYAEVAIRCGNPQYAGSLSTDSLLEPTNRWLPAVWRRQGWLATPSVDSQLSSAATTRRMSTSINLPPRGTNAKFFVP